MRHQTIIRDLSSLLDGELDADGREAILGHLKTCDSCRTEYEGLQKLHGLSTALKPSGIREPSPYFEARLRARIAEGPGAPPGAGLKRLPALAVLSAAFIFLFIIGSTFGSFAVALGQKDPAVREKVITDTVRGMSGKPSVINLVNIMNLCHGCHAAICTECAACASGGPAKGCCPAGRERGGPGE
jgi:anti-sigma factor RsiW